MMSSSVNQFEHEPSMKVMQGSATQRHLNYNHEILINDMSGSEEPDTLGEHLGNTEPGSRRGALTPSSTMIHRS